MTALLRLFCCLFRRTPAHLRGRPHDGGTGTRSQHGPLERYPRLHDEHLAQQAGRYWLEGKEVEARQLLDEANAAAQKRGEFYMLDASMKAAWVRPTPEDPRGTYLASIPTIFEAEGLGVTKEWRRFHEERAVLARERIPWRKP